MIQYRGEQLALIPLARPGAPTLTRSGAPGETTYTYVCVAKHSSGHTEASEAASVMDAPATLTILNRIDVRPPYVQGAQSYDVYRTAGGASQGKIGSVVAYNRGTVQQAQVRDHGQAGDDAEAPTINTTGLLRASGQAICVARRVLTSAEVLDAAVPEYTLIAGPGAGFFVHVLSITNLYHFGTVAYEEVGGHPYWSLYYGSAAGVRIDAPDQDLTGEVDALFYRLPQNDLTNTAEFVLDNQPVVVVQDSGHTYDTGDGTLTWVLRYEVIDLTTGLPVLQV